jgi:hypothetical protein
MTITLTREEAQYIFETLDNLPVKIWGETAAQILRTRLAQSEPEPTLICPTCKADRFKEDCKGNRIHCGLKFEAFGVQPEPEPWAGVDFDVKTAPPQREWQGLTDEEHMKLAEEWGCLSADWVLYAAAIERKIKEKNT